MLTNYDLMKVARELKFSSLVVVSKDDLKKIRPNVGNYIINLDWAFETFECIPKFWLIHQK